MEVHIISDAFEASAVLDRTGLNSHLFTEKNGIRNHLIKMVPDTIFWHHFSLRGFRKSV
jgi:hypothetical protein